MAAGAGYEARTPPEAVHSGLLPDLGCCAGEQARAAAHSLSGLSGGGPMIRIYQGNVLTRIAEIPDGSIHCLVTSPPYFGLRSYLPEGSPDKVHEVGFGQSMAEYIETMVLLFRAVRPKLRDDATVWLNIADSYARQGGVPPDGLKPKDLCLVPHRLAIALQEDGWWVRSDVVWAKGAAMPESVTDRPAKAHEYVFLLSKAPRYFFDMDAVREPLDSKPHAPGNRAAFGAAKRNDFGTDRMKEAWGSESGRNLRSWWAINPEASRWDYCMGCDSFYAGKTRPKKAEDGSLTCPRCGRVDGWVDHYALMAPRLAERCILAGTSEKGCCPACGAPWVRVVEHERVRNSERKAEHHASKANASPQGGYRGTKSTVTTGWVPTCECNACDPVPCMVLDPFSGAGTTAMVAARLGRDAVGFELSPSYVALSRARIFEDQPLLNSVEVLL